MAREEREKPPEDRLQFREVRDAAGRLLLRVTSSGIVEVKRKNCEPVLIDITVYLDGFRRR